MPTLYAKIKRLAKNSAKSKNRLTTNLYSIILCASRGFASSRAHPRTSYGELYRGILLWEIVNGRIAAREIQWGEFVFWRDFPEAIDAMVSSGRWSAEAVAGMIEYGLFEQQQAPYLPITNGWGWGVGEWEVQTLFGEWILLETLDINGNQIGLRDSRNDDVSHLLGNLTYVETDVPWEPLHFFDTGVIISFLRSEENDAIITFTVDYREEGSASFHYNGIRLVRTIVHLADGYQLPSENRGRFIPNP